MKLKFISSTQIKSLHFINDTLITQKNNKDIFQPHLFNLWLYILKKTSKVILLKYIYIFKSILFCYPNSKSIKNGGGR